DSTRLPGKPLADLAGRSLIERVYLRASQSRVADAVWIATDDERIYQEVYRFGGKAAMTSREHQSGTDRLAEVVQQLEQKKEPESAHNSAATEVSASLQGDEPFGEIEKVDEAIQPVLDGNFQMATLANRTLTEENWINPNSVKVL